MTIGDFVKIYREENDMSMEEFAKLCGVSKGYISMLENNTNPRNGKPIAPTLKSMQKIAGGIGMTVDELLRSIDGGQKVTVAEKKRRTGTCRMVPLFETVSAGTGAFADSNVIDYIPIPEDLKGNLYAVKVRGDSMTPLIMDGDILIVDKDSRVQNMDTVIATVNGDDGFVKRLARYATGIALVSNNPAYPPLYFSMEDVENKPVLIQGRVKRIIRDI